MYAALPLLVLAALVPAHVSASGIVSRQFSNITTQPDPFLNPVHTTYNGSANVCEDGWLNCQALGCAPPGGSCCPLRGVCGPDFICTPKGCCPDDGSICSEEQMSPDFDPQATPSVQTTANPSLTATAGASSSSGASASASSVVSSVSGAVSSAISSATAAPTSAPNGAAALAPAGGFAALVVGAIALVL